MRADRLEQLFVRRRGGGTELLLVLESEAGARQRVTLQAPPSADELAAIAFLARWLDRSGAAPAPRLRVRRERGGELADAPELRSALLRELAGEGES